MSPSPVTAWTITYGRRAPAGVGCGSARRPGSPAPVPDWRHHAFVTDREGTAVDLDADHRRHAVMELAVRDLKEGSGLNHCPSGRFAANAAWLVIAALAHNFVRWVASLGLTTDGPVVVATVRRKFFTIPGRLTRSARQLLLHLPTHWPWGEAFSGALDRLRTVALVT